MKPLNSDNPGCTPVSSDCVIWQGADIECINLCKGDTVSKVVEKLATQLCAILDMLDVNAYDLSCFNLSDCTPKDFQALLQLIIEKICTLENISPTDPSGTGGTGCPDCVVNIASCFYFDNPQGDQETTMQLTDYVTAIGNEICKLVSSAGTVDSALASQSLRIKTLEDAPVVEQQFADVLPVCVLPPDLVPLDIMTKELEKQFCALRTATGTPQEIYNALVVQSAGLNSAKQLNKGSAVMSDLPEWNTTITSFAEGFTNMLLTVTDMRSAILSIQESCCTTTSCDDLDIAIQGVITDPVTLKLYLTGTYPSGFQETIPTGSIVTITDALGNSMTATIQIVANLNTPDGYTIDLTDAPINASTNLIISIPLSFVETGGDSQCQKVITDVVLNEAVCPSVILTPGDTTIDYAMTYLGTAGSIKVILYAADGTTEISNQTTIVTGPQSVSGQFTGLNPGIEYKIQLEITITGAPAPTLCPFASTSTLSPLCLQPIVTGVTLNVT